jgi:hypothetical protein
MSYGQYFACGQHFLVTLIAYGKSNELLLRLLFLLHISNSG